MTDGFQNLRMLPASERGLVVELGNVISSEVNACVQWLAKQIDKKSIAGVIEVVPTYRSLLVYFDPLKIVRSELIETIQQMILSKKDQKAAEKVRVIQVPVCYGGEFGPDIDYVAQHHGLSIEEIITIHSGRYYLVYMLGFTPGFPYLGGMSKKIATPRLEKPRVTIPQGSVGITSLQTGIYPIESPGGWRLIGRTPLNLFVADAPHPFLFTAGDYVKFTPISMDEFHKIRHDVKAGLFSPVIHKEYLKSIIHAQND